VATLRVIVRRVAPQDRHAQKPRWISRAVRFILHPQRMDGPRRTGRVITVGLPILGFLLAALFVYAILRHLWPQQHDLSDIGTALMRLLIAFAAGLVGALLTHLAIRLVRR